MGKNGKLKVVIIGGGLVGALCASFMAKKGYKVDLYEQRDDIRTAKLRRGRSINLALSNRGRAALKAINLEETILHTAIPMRGRRVHQISGEQNSVPYDTRTNQCIHSIGRNNLNGVLLAAAEEYPNVNLYFNHKLIDVDFEEDRLTLLNTKTGETVIQAADLIIGADGARSTLRSAMQQLPLFEYSQTYIDHGYLELEISSEKGGGMVPNHLHIWPRGDMMMIALPNHDGSWTVTLFMPFSRFAEIKTESDVLSFFNTTFPDVLNLMGESAIIDTFLNTKPSCLVSVKCSPYNYRKFLVVGDAAHAMVPFYGQGMNAGFEDCLLLDELLQNRGRKSLEEALEEYTQRRKEDVQVMCDLAMYNYVEMRELVTKRSFQLRKKLDEFLSMLFSEKWIPLYHSVTFSRMRYKECIENRKWQDRVLKNTFLGITGSFVFALALMWMVHF